MTNLVPAVIHSSRLVSSGDISPAEFLAQVDVSRMAASAQLNPDRRAEMGQFLTPSPIARQMAALFTQRPARWNILDAGAGVGSLSAALVAEICSWEHRPREIEITAYEVDSMLSPPLTETLGRCAILCQRAGIQFQFVVKDEDFIRSGVGVLQGQDLFSSKGANFNAAILNPPYRKINSDSETRRLLRMADIETTNLYTAFLWLSLKLLKPGGELVAITPRSFCNGTYYRPFRQALRESARFRSIHLFETRDQAFSDDDVLQENIIFDLVKSTNELPAIITANSFPGDEFISVHQLPHHRIMRPDDLDAVIHLPTDGLSEAIEAQISALPATLDDLKLNISTGEVVDFRVKDFLRAETDSRSVPLIYPGHFENGFITWPKADGKKANALHRNSETEALIIPADFYVLVKRFSAKEEIRRIVAAVLEPDKFATDHVALENHLNYFHHNGAGLPANVAKGLAAFLNSTLVDCYFRQFSGHTQVNAADLRSLRYPLLDQLSRLGNMIGHAYPPQDALDTLVQKELFAMVTKTTIDPINAKKKLAETLALLKELDVPKEQQNERSALTLLALLDLKAETPWLKAGNPLYGITEMMDYFADHFGKKYAPNTRETVRRQTIHQFVQLGLVIQNPDNPGRAVNSPDNRYQVSADALTLFRQYRSKNWSKALKAFRKKAASMGSLHSSERDMQRIPVTLPDGQLLTFTAGGQNPLVKAILEQFCSRYTPGAKVIYAGDTGDKHLLFDGSYLKSLGVTIDKHGKMPDVVVHHVEKNWLILVEAVTSHGPINLKRHNELKKLFAASSAGLVFVTAFIDRKTMAKHLSVIAWETEVWVAESPSHLVHFNGERFLGPYAK